MQPARQTAASPARALAVPDSSTGNGSSSRALGLSAASQDAPPRALVAIDRDGHVISPLRRYAGQAAAYGALGLLGTIGFYTLAAGDPLVMALSLVGTAAWGHGILVTHWLERSSALILRGDLDTAERLLQRCLRPPWGSEAVRAHAHLRLSSLYSRRGEHRMARDAAAVAVRLFGAEYPPQPQFVQLARYQEIRALVSAGRQPDARLLFEDVSSVPVGDYLRAQHYVTELYVALADSRLPLLDAALWERCELALRTPSADALLGLCAWGYAQLGDIDTSRHLLQLARQRSDEPLAQTMPLLHRWMEAAQAR